MSVNRFHPHVMLLPEDSANSRVATGFHLQIDSARQRQMQVLEEAGGWTEVLNVFEKVHAKEMTRCSSRFMILLIDFDGDEGRLAKARARIPVGLTERVFILGALTEPEDLKTAGLGSYETIGMAMARDCRDGTDRTWGHDLLRHNSNELNRVRQRLCPILFPPI